jgi:hypothetical protein
MRLQRLYLLLAADAVVFALCWVGFAKGYNDEGPWAWYAGAGFLLGIPSFLVLVSLGLYTLLRTIESFQQSRERTRAPREP